MGKGKRLRMEKRKPKPSGPLKAQGIPRTVRRRRKMLIWGAAGLAGILAAGHMHGKYVESKQRAPHSVLLRTDKLKTEIPKVYTIQFPKRFSPTLRAQTRQRIEAALAAIYQYVPQLWKGIETVKPRLEFGDPDEFQRQNPQSGGGLVLQASAVTLITYDNAERRVVTRTIFNAKKFERDTRQLFKAAIHEFSANVALAPIRAVQFRNRILTAAERRTLEYEVHDFGIGVMERIRDNLNSNVPEERVLIQELAEGIKNDQAWLDLNFPKGKPK